MRPKKKHQQKLILHFKQFTLTVINHVFYFPMQRATYEPYGAIFLRCHVRDWPVSVVHIVYPVTCHHLSFERLRVSNHCHESHGYE